LLLDRVVGELEIGLFKQILFLLGGGGGGGGGGWGNKKLTCPNFPPHMSRRAIEAVASSYAIPLGCH